MGNTAVITTKQGWTCKENNLGIYLHWNGGRDSVEGFLAYCKLKGYRPPESDNYGWAALAMVISNGFGADGMSVGIDIVSRLDCEGDNGVYIIENWEIVDRACFTGHEQDRYDLNEFVKDLDSCMPEEAQLGAEFFAAKVIPTEDIEVGDTVYMQEINGSYKPFEVIGFGEDRWVNGHKALGVPYCKRFENNGVYTENPNNYVWEPTARVVKAAPKEQEV